MITCVPEFLTVVYFGPQEEKYDHGFDPPKINV